MKKENLLNLFLFIIIGVLVVVGSVQAATTISTNIVTEGTLSVTGTSTLAIGGGNVGVGTSTPAARLVVDGIPGQHILQIATSTNQNIFRINQRGQVGIGMDPTNVASSILEIGGKNNIAVATQKINMMITDSTPNSDVVPGGGAGLSFRAQTSFGNTTIGGIWAEVEGANTNGSLYLMARGGAVSSGPDMTITSGGNVGIGTTTPATRLHVSSGASATTTVTIGELGLSSSKGCVNINRSDGGAGSFYLNAVGAIVSEANYCR